VCIAQQLPVAPVITSNSALRRTGPAFSASTNASPAAICCTGQHHVVAQFLAACPGARVTAVNESCPPTVPAPAARVPPRSASPPTIKAQRALPVAPFTPARKPAHRGWRRGLARRPAAWISARVVDRDGGCVNEQRPCSAPREVASAIKPAFTMAPFGQARVITTSGLPKGRLRAAVENLLRPLSAAASDKRGHRVEGPSARCGPGPAVRVRRPSGRPWWPNPQEGNGSVI